MDDVQHFEARREAALALQAGAQLAQRVAQKRGGLAVDQRPSGAALGALLGDPSAFWASAATSEALGDQDTVGGLALANRLAAARLAAGDMGFVRDSLIGQAQWLGVVAVKMLDRADQETKVEKASLWTKLGLAAARQSAQNMASAAALGKLATADSIQIGD